MWSTWTEKATKSFTEAQGKVSKGLSEALEKTGEALGKAEKHATEGAKGLTEALERTGEAITKAATQTKPNLQEPDAAANDSTTPTEQQEQQPPSRAGPSISVDRAQVLQNLQMGWSSVVESTRRTVEATKEAVDMERSRLEQNFLKKGFYKRDPRLPLDVDALRDAEVVYITDRIITMSHPAMASSVIPAVTAERKLAAVGHLLHRRHDGLLLKLLVSMENWMKADERNVAVVHCLTGKGRTSTVLGAFLCWMGEAGFGDIHEALAYIAKCKQLRPEELTIPSQRRYAAYFKNMLDGVRPSQPPLVLKRIIMSEAPKFAKGPPRDDIEPGETENSEEKLMGCAPYLQIFKAGKLIFTTAAKLSVQQADEELPFVQKVDGIVPFNVEQIIQGDILIRCRHLTFKKQRVSMFRAAFHTGYVPPNVLRLNKSQLDGACSDTRFPDDFFLDLIFEKADAETATKHLEEEGGGQGGEIDETKGRDTKGRGPVVTASGFDAMLQGDSRFWDVIAQKKEEQVQNKSDDPLFGPTVGRRRGDSSKKEERDVKNEITDKTPKERTQLETFSIGNEFDFLPVENITPPSVAQSKDDLMEALDALDEDEYRGTEEIVFDSTQVVVESEPPPGSKDNEAGDSCVENGDMEKETTTSASAEESVKSDSNVDDMDALLASAGDDFGDLDLDGLDDDDDDLEDLESFLAT